ncbi:uncharacterized protein LOC144180611 [Haemaphysalis longicornis]
MKYAPVTIGVWALILATVLQCAAQSRNLQLCTPEDVERCQTTGRTCELHWGVDTCVCLSPKVEAHGQCVDSPSVDTTDKCKRALSPPNVECKYICQGWPIRLENEPDGTVCQLGHYGQDLGVCVSGQCESP